MSIGSVAFSEAPFSSKGFNPDAKVTPAGLSLTLTLSNA